MIVTKLIGGLGNQMFQYAAGRALALVNNCQLKLDILGFEKYRLDRHFELNSFNIQAEIATHNDISRFTGSQTRLVKFSRARLGLYKSTHIVEQAFSFNTSFFGIKQPAYLDGYWQSYKYFESFSDQIRVDLRPKNLIEGANLTVAELINKTNSVSIHIRRGDYVTNPSTNKVHGFVGLDYYIEAMRYMRERVHSSHYFVFSDDLEWAKSNLCLKENVSFVSNNAGATSYEDMRLMSLCKHNVIANSSFSWWGAWLNQNPNKIIIYPKKWFNNVRICTKDLAPKHWVAI